MAHDGWADHAQAQGRKARRAGASVFHGEQIALHGIPAGAAIFRGPGRRGPALAIHDFVPVLGGAVFRQYSGAQTRGLADIWRYIILQKGPHIALENLQFIR